MAKYTGMKNDELRAILKQHKMPHTGTKVNLLERLRTLDEITGNDKQSANALLNAISGSSVSTDRLQQLPPELRERIYEFALVKPDATTLRHDYRYPPAVDPHRTRVIGPSRWSYDDNTDTRSIASYSGVPLLRVNKLTYEEAAPVFYSSNTFNFQDPAHMEGFLRQIGDNKQHLRHFSLEPRFGSLFINKFDRLATRNSLNLLVEARNLRSLTIDHRFVCPITATKRVHSHFRDVPRLVQACKPLLKSLQESYESKGLKTNILDVIKIVLPSCEKHQDQPPHPTDYCRFKMCSCDCNNPEEDHQKLIMAVRERITEKLLTPKVKNAEPDRKVTKKKKKASTRWTKKRVATGRASKVEEVFREAESPVVPTRREVHSSKKPKSAGKGTRPQATRSSARIRETTKK